MARQTIKAVVDMSNCDIKQRLKIAIGPMQGMYKIEIVPKRDTRSLRQNSWYFAAIVAPFYDFLREQDYEVGDIYDAHCIIKEKFLLTPIINRGTGEVIGHREGSTKEMDTAQFSDFAERVRAWLRDQFGIETLDPAEYGIAREMEATTR